MAAHLRTFFKECGSFAHTIIPGKRIHLRTQFLQVNVTFAHIIFSLINGMFTLTRVYMYRQANPVSKSKLYIFIIHFIRQVAFKAQPVVNI